MSLSMVIDKGAAGLDQSRHHPDAGQSTSVIPAPRPQNEKEAEEAGGGDLKALKMQFESLIALGHATDALKIACAYIIIEKRISSDNNILTDQPIIRKDILKAVQKAIKTVIPS